MPRLIRTACLLSLFSIIFPGAAFAETDSGDTAWIMTATALVLFMTLPGLALFYGGLVRQKNVLSVLMQCFAIACMVSLLWVILGYSLAFADGNALVGGFGKVFLAGVGVDTATDTIPETVFVMFQMTFAIITPALVIGAFAERMRFSAMLLFSALWLLLVYAPVTHWVWGGGWLAQRGFMEFLPKSKIEIAVGDDLAERAIEAITNAARTGKVGDGKIFVTDLEHALHL